MNTNFWAVKAMTPFGGEDKTGESDAGNIDGQNNPPSGTNTGGAQQDSKKGTADGAAGAQSDDDADDDEFKDYSPRELRRIARDLANRAKTAETERDTVKSTLTEKEREKLNKEERLEADLTDAGNANATLRATNARLAITNAIMLDQRFTWHDPEMVAQQLNSAVVKVSDEGKVEGIANELKRVAKDHAFLLKKDNTKPNNPQQNTQQQEGPTGFQPGQGGATQGGSLSADQKVLQENYPALVNRM